MIDDKPGPQTQMMLIAKAAAALGENWEALQEIEKIVNGYQTDE